MSLILATWNVNSLRARIGRVVEWIEYAEPDILCLQETKMDDSAFPEDVFNDLGYSSVHHGDGGWNGVAILSRVGLEDAEKGMGDRVDEMGCRVVSADCGGISVVCVYVPNGREVGSRFYHEKLDWLATLKSYIAQRYSPTDALIVCGDFNIAPDERDVWDEKAFEGATHVSEPERAALNELLVWGLSDCFRAHYSQADLFSWWDYRGGAFHRHQGMRIDLILATMPVLSRCSFSLMDRNARKGDKPSDHIPVMAWIENE